MKTFEPVSKSIIDLELAKQVVEKHMSDLLTVGERNVDLEIFHQRCLLELSVSW